MSFCEFATKKIQVRNRTIGAGAPIFLTAEIGAAHGGSVENAKTMIHAAAQAGCDGADIFMADPEAFYVIGTSMKPRDMIKEWHKLAFTDDEWMELFAYAKKEGIILYPTPLDLPSIERCRRFKVEMININSDDTNNYFMLKAAASLGVPMTVHDINIGLTEINFAVRTLLDHGAKDIILLHSTQESGTIGEQYASANLEVMNSYRQLFGGNGVLTGCVEHTSSDFLIYAVSALRPVLISKHIQLNPKENEADAAISVNVEQLNTMVRNVRYVEQAMGGGINQIVVTLSNAESEWCWARRKVLVSAREIPAGKVITEEDLTAKRPGNIGGVNPMQYVHFVGATACETIPENTILEYTMIDNAQPAPYKYPAMDQYVSPQNP